MDRDRHTGNPIVWHYTDIEGALSIIRSHTLRASWATMLNDSLEVRLGARKVAEAWRAHRRDEWPQDVKALLDSEERLTSYVERNGFVFCASGKGDSLQHWQNYGRGGVALGLGMSPYMHTSNMVMMGVLNPAYADEDKSSADVMYQVDDQMVQRWYPVVYETGAQDALASQILNNVGLALTREMGEWQNVTPVGLAQALLVAGVLQMKDESFSGEDEWRWIALRPLDGRAVHHRTRNGRLIPYVELTGNPGSGAQAASGAIDECGRAWNLPLSQFRFGPDGHPENEAALVDLLNAHAYPWPEYQQIRHSTLSYRA